MIMTKKKRTIIEGLYEKYHKSEYLKIDPLLCVHPFENRESLEIVGLLAAILSYGKVNNIIRSIENVLKVMGTDIVSYVDERTLTKKYTDLDSFKHRFNSGNDIAEFLEIVKICRQTYGSLENLFLDCMSKSGTGLLKEGLTLFSNYFKDSALNLKRRKNDRDYFNYLFPSPESGSACKRLCMFLRWMVRPKDSIDLGVWASVSTNILIIPVDTHIAKVSKSIGLTTRNSADWKMAEEITEELKKIDNEDPVKFDFSLCRYGMLE